MSLDLVKVFISHKSLGFSKSRRQRVIFAVLVLFFLNSQYVCPFPCGCLLESLVFHGPRCLVFVQLDPDHPGSPPFWNKVYCSHQDRSLRPMLKTAASLLFANKNMVKNATWSNSCHLWHIAFRAVCNAGLLFLFSVIDCQSKAWQALYFGISLGKS